MDNFPLVTIGIPNYNYAYYILDALNSVANQSYPNIELIIVDDLSTDNSIGIIENWIKDYQGNLSINFIKNKANVGLTKVCNLIIKNARGKYFQPLDADDTILPEKIEKQVAFMEGNPDFAMVYANVGVINEKGIITNPNYCSRINYDKDCMPSGNIFDDLLIFNFISLPSVLIKTSIAQQLGGFDESLRVQDYYLWLAISKKYHIGYMNEVLANYRIHTDSMSNLVRTNIDFEESVMTLKYRYYNTSNTEIKKIIAKNIQNSSVYLYEHKSPKSKKWLTIACQLNPGLKTRLYYYTIRLGIPFSFFGSLKSLFLKKRSIKMITGSSLQ